MSRALKGAEASESGRQRPLILWAQVVALLVGLALTIPTEIAKFRVAGRTKVGAVAWFFFTELDTTFPFVLFAILPVAWLVRSKRSQRDENRSVHRVAASREIERTRAAAGRRIPWAMALACAVTSIAASAWIASTEITVEEKQPPARFGDLPPAIHDEFSYLFQAKTFLTGRLSFPSSSRMPELFDQMHVLNEGRFASKFFPGVGLWLAPFVAIGHPYWGEWLAGAGTAFFIFWAARELAGDWVGLAAGLLTALSPGMGLFTNLLLSHGPTMAALAFFLFLFLRFLRTGRAGDAFGAGCGLSFAMLCRPLTASGFALPFGMWFLWDLVRAAVRGRTKSASPSHDPLSLRLRPTAALVAPLIVGLAGLFLYDRAITGNGFQTPYQLYLATYIPRHTYGFNNGVRGERNRGPKVLDQYNRWADNLTPELALRNVQKRLEASAQWTLGPVPLAMAAVVFLLVTVWQFDWRWRLLAAAIVSLHAAHVPYWLAGIMNWSYVFETGPLLLMLFAVTSQQLVAIWRESHRPLMPVWWSALVASAVMTNWLPFDPFWNARIDEGVAELSIPRVKYEKLERLIDQSITRRPALLLIEGDPADVHTDYLVNDPDLRSPVVRGRYRPGRTDLAQVHSAFPDRAVYLYQAGSDRIRPVN